MEPLGLDIPALAKAIAVDPARLLAVVEGSAAIDGELDLRLARYFGGDAHSWLNLQAMYARKIEREII